MLIAAQEQLLT